MERLFALVAVMICLSCSSGGGGSGNGSADGGTTSTTGDGSQYNTFQGTFVGTGINATIAGSMQGTDSAAEDGLSAWNGVSTFVRDPSGVAPPELVATWAAPSGDVTSVLVNVGDITGDIIGGTFTCSGQNPAGAQAAIQFLVTAAGGTAVYNYGATTCTITFQTPLTKVVSNGITVYFAHGSLTAEMTSYLPGSETPNGTGVMNATW